MARERVYAQVQSHGPGGEELQGRGSGWSVGLILLTAVTRKDKW